MKSFTVVGGDSAISNTLRGFGLIEIVDEDNSTERADIAVFTGGADVHPSWYSEKAIKGCHYNQARDDREMEIYWTAYASKKICIGICRGAQLIHVANGGHMWQNVTGHGRTHPVLDVKSGQCHVVTSCHHQMMRVDIHDKENKFQIVAIANESDMRQTDGLTIHPRRLTKGSDTRFSNDIEVLWYPEAKSLCYQPHPEYGLASCTSYFRSLLIRYNMLDIRATPLSSNPSPSWVSEMFPEEEQDDDDGALHAGAIDLENNILKMA